MTLWPYKACFADRKGALTARPGSGEENSPRRAAPLSTAWGAALFNYALGAVVNPARGIEMSACFWIERKFRNALFFCYALYLRLKVLYVAGLLVFPIQEGIGLRYQRLRIFWKFYSFQSFCKRSHRHLR